MANLWNGGAACNVDDLPDDEHSCLPPGEYPVRIVNTDVTPTKAGTGQILVLEIQVEEGQHKGRKFWERLNIVNQSQTAQKIGQAMLKKVVKACGIQGPLADSNQLHNIPFIAATKIQTDDYGDKTVLKNAKPYQNPGAQTTTVQTTQQQRPANVQTTQQQTTTGQPGGGAPGASSGGGMPWDS